MAKTVNGFWYYGRKGKDSTIHDRPTQFVDDYGGSKRVPALVDILCPMCRRNTVPSLNVRFESYLIRDPRFVFGFQRYWAQRDEDTIFVFCGANCYELYTTAPLLLEYLR